MELPLHPITINVEGDIKENFDMVKLNLPSNTQVEFNLSGLRFMNSSGIKEWLSGIKKNNISPIYTNCPTHFILNLGCIKEFFENQAHVESFFVNGFCDSCKTVIPIHFKTQRIESSSISEIEKQLKCPIHGTVCESEDDLEMLLYFRKEMLR